MAYLVFFFGVIVGGMLMDMLARRYIRQLSAGLEQASSELERLRDLELRLGDIQSVAGKQGRSEREVALQLQLAECRVDCEILRDKAVKFDSINDFTLSLGGIPEKDELTRLKEYVDETSKIVARLMA